LPYGFSFADKLEKVYTVTPSFRQEQPTKRHLSEYWRIEAVQKGGFYEIIEAQEKLIASICGSLSKLKESLDFF
jgi:aspartyl/asparaginyl-tRNA synthetase